MSILSGNVNIAVMTNKIIRIVCLLCLMGLLATCNKDRPPVFVKVILAPDKIDYGDSFNIVLVCSGGAGVLPEIRTQNVEEFANLRFISATQEEKTSVICYKLRPKNPGPLKFTRDMILVPVGAKVDFDEITVNVIPPSK